MNLLNAIVSCLCLILACWLGGSRLVQELWEDCGGC